MIALIWSFEKYENAEFAAKAIETWCHQVADCRGKVSNVRATVDVAHNVHVSEFDLSTLNVDCMTGMCRGIALALKDKSV